MTEKDIGRAVLWRRHRGKPRRRTGGGGHLGEVVRVGTGEALCADGQHVAKAADVNPELAGIAKQVVKDYPECVMTVYFGFLLRTVLRDALTSVSVEARTEEELRDGITRQVRIRELAAWDVGAREAAQS
jgi:hypothetical protein